MDIQMATQYARSMVIEWGMSDKLGFVNYSGSDTSEMYIPEKDYSPETAHMIDNEVRRIIDTAFAETEKIIDEQWDKVVAVAEALLKFETLLAEEVDSLMQGQRLDKPTVAELLDAEAARKKSSDSGSTESREGPDDEPAAGTLPSPA